jgi:hypothetical protein
LKRIILALSLTLCALVVPATASAHPMTGRHFGVYRYVYRHALKQFGQRQVGCELVYTCAGPASDEVVVGSTRTLERMLHPRPSFHATATVVAGPTEMVDPGLESCIINAESTWNSQAVNGTHEGYGQWDADAWARADGLRYAPTPLDASPSQQIAVLNYEVEHHMTSMQTDYDPC